LMQDLSDLAADAKAGKRGLRGNRNKHRHAHDLIVNLEHVAVSTGGGFTFDQHGGRHGPRGSLIDAITLLRNYFPDGFFPTVMTATEQRDLQEARRRKRSTWHLVSS
jgi:hypothetical protein